jgi:MOSC domain-containing protein YiiM
MGDHYSAASRKRQVTLMQRDFLDQVSKRMGFEVDMSMTRRNILVEHAMLTDLIGKKFRLGTAILEGTGHCKPCLQMDVTIGAGGLKAMKGLAGITACVVEDGEVIIGDELLLI